MGYEKKKKFVYFDITYRAICELCEEYDVRDYPKQSEIVMKVKEMAFIETRDKNYLEKYNVQPSVSKALQALMTAGKIENKGNRYYPCDAAVNRIRIRQELEKRVVFGRPETFMMSRNTIIVDVKKEIDIACTLLSQYAGVNCYDVVKIADDKLMIMIESRENGKQDFKNTMEMNNLIGEIIKCVRECYHYQHQKNKQKDN